MSETTVFVIGYIPLLYPNQLKFDRSQYLPGQMVDTEKFLDSEQFPQLVDRCLEKSRPAGVLWEITEGKKPHLSIIVPNAKEVHEHLIFWCEGKPDRWFTLMHYQNQEQYAVAIVPCRKQMTRRYKMANDIAAEYGQAKRLPPDAKFTIVCHPLAVDVPHSTRNKECYEMFCKLTKENPSVRVSLVDLEYVQEAGKWASDPQKIQEVILSKSLFVADLKCEERPVYGK